VSVLKLGYECVTGRLLLPMELGEGVSPAPIAHLVLATRGRRRP
jgi:hypothetical protein